MTSNSKVPTGKFNPKALSNAAVAAMVKASAEAQHNLRVTDRDSRIAAARATYAVKARGEIGKGMIYANQRDYAMRAGLTRYDSKSREYVPVSGSTVTALGRIGHALALGFDPTGKDSTGWGVLSHEANNSLAEVLDDEKVTLTAIRKAISAARTASKDRASKGRKAQPEGKGKDEKDSPEESRKPGLSTSLDLVKALDVATRPLSAAEWSKVEDALHALITKNVTLHRKASESTPKATPATVAKVTRKTA